MKKAISGCFTAIGVIVVLLVVLALGCSNSGDKAKDTGKDEAAQVETKADDKKDEEEEQGQKAEAEDEGKKSDTSDKESNTSDKEPEEPAQENKTDFPDEFIRPEFQEFCDAYVAFYREYADYMKRYNENPSDVELMSGLASMLQREADMVEACHGWEAEDLTPAEEALYAKTMADVLRINAEILENSN